MADRFEEGYRSLTWDKLTTIIDKLQVLLVRRGEQLECNIDLMNAMHNKCYRWASLRDSICKQRAEIFDLQNRRRELELKV